MRKRNRYCNWKSVIAVGLILLSMGTISMAAGGVVEDDSWKTESTTLTYQKISYESLSAPEKAIWDFYDTVNVRDDAHPDGDWETRVELYDESMREAVRGFSEKQKNRESHIGIFNMKSCQIVYMEETETAPAEKEGKEDLTIETYVVGMKCEVFNDEDKFSYDGVNFNEVVVCERDSNWYILGCRSVSVQQLLAIENEALTEEAISFWETNRMTVSTNGTMSAEDGDESVPYQPCSSNVEPEEINVWYVTNDENEVIPYLFSEYVTRVLHSEMGYGYAYISNYISGITQAQYEEGLKANAMACKMYAWWHVAIKRRHIDQGANICNSSSCCQTYERGENLYSHVVSAVEAISDVGVRTDTGWIIFSHYRSGNSWENGGTAHTGKLLQKESFYLASQGKTYREILSHFYSNVPEEVAAPHPDQPNTISRGELIFFEVTH